ncbi:hypothetical protein [Natrinema soli]|uniref:Uncharacterized protein n=1 Tax=Natrinema soli TaxID=1930624 RepID=A0ABD5STN9_9EURY|nr:hypothetical protein [Natrinema soli]
MSEPDDVLGQTTRNDLEQKIDGEIPVGHLPFWQVAGTPRRTEPGRAIPFSDGQRVIATLEGGRIWFSPLEEVDDELPDDAPSRGFTSVDPAEGPASRCESGAANSPLRWPILHDGEMIR